MIGSFMATLILLVWAAQGGHLVSLAWNDGRPGWAAILALATLSLGWPLIAVWV